MINQEFNSLIQDITHSEGFIKLKKNKHHINGTVYDHSVKVAYLCYKHHKRFGLNIEIQEFVRGALLHDYYLYDSHDKSMPHKFHWFRHPGYALHNALEKYPSLTKTQQDMIKHHMFPITPIPPSTKAGWLLCFYDKVAAVSDCLGKNAGEAAGISPKEPKRKGKLSFKLTKRKHFKKKSKTNSRYDTVIKQRKGDSTMSKITETNDKFAEKVAEGYKKVENGVVEGYKKIENGVVKGYKKIENSVVDGFNKVSDKCVETFFAKEGETVDEAKKRLSEK